MKMIDLEIEVPKNFYHEEIRYGYTVSKKMKKIWAVELDLLNKIVSVCQKYGIKIFASGGTLLGAVRHKGFIPWDDDIDLMMFRSDYNRLCEVAKFEFGFPYFFQTEYNDPGSLRGHAQLRNSLTTAIMTYEKGIKTFNQGIFVDVFPLDNVAMNPLLMMDQGKKVRKYYDRAFHCSRLSSRYIANETEGIKGKVKDCIYPVVNCILRNLKLEEHLYNKFELACQEFNSEPTEVVSTLSLDFDNKKFYKDRKDFDEIIYLPFEFLSIPVGRGYDHALQKRFGDYRQIVKDSSLHGGVFFDPEVSYLKYIG